jgi:hypothetical protein
MYLKIVAGYAPQSVEHSGTISHILTESEKREAKRVVEQLIAYDSEGEHPLMAEVAGENEAHSKARHTAIETAT